MRHLAQDLPQSRGFEILASVCEVTGPRPCLLPAVEQGRGPKRPDCPSVCSPQSLGRKHARRPVVCFHCFDRALFLLLLGRSEACRGPCRGQALDPVRQRHGGRERGESACGPWTASCAASRLCLGLAVLI